MSLLYAYLAAIFARLGHRVEYGEDRPPAGADLYIFNPSLLTLALEHAGDCRLAGRKTGGAGAGGGHGGFGAAGGVRAI